MVQKMRNKWKWKPSLNRTKDENEDDNAKCIKCSHFLLYIHHMSEDMNRQLNGKLKLMGI